MRSPVFKVNVVEFLILLLVVAAQAAVDVFILDKNDYPDNSFTLDHLESMIDGNVEVIGDPIVAVQAKISFGDNFAKITWPNIAVESQQNTGAEEEFEIRPEYKTAFFVLATNPNIDGRRSFIILTNVTAVEGDNIEITVPLGSFREDEKEILNEPDKTQNSQNNDETALTPEVGEDISRGTCGKVYSVTYKNGPLFGKELVMKTCEANKPGTVVRLFTWASLDLIEKINRNDYRIGSLLNPLNEGTNKIGPKYYTEGSIQIEGKHCYYFTMEKIIGETINDDFKEAETARLQGDLSKFAKMFSKMLNAIIRLHKAGVLHRDLHNGNFMKLQESREYITIDYGFSRVAVEWENHIKLNRTVETELAGMQQTLRAHFNLGTDFHDEMDMFVFHNLKLYINQTFFGDPYEQILLIDNKIQVLVSNWLEWDHLQKYMKYMTDSLAENLNDMLFLSLTLLYCRGLHNQNLPSSLDQNEVKLSLKATDENLFPKTAGQMLEYEYNHSGYLKQKFLPVVEGRYKWPEYDQYKTAISNIERKKGGIRHPRDNPLEMA